MTTATHDQLADALHNLAGVFGDGLVASMIGGSFTCSEADEIASALKVSGHAEAAAVWLQGHAIGDDDEEDNHRDLVEVGGRQTDGSEAAAIKYVADL